MNRYRQIVSWLRARPFVVLLVPLIAIILLLPDKWLLRETEVKWLDQPYTFQARIKDYPVERAKSYRLTAEVTAYSDSAWHATTGTIYLYLAKDSAVAALLPNDMIAFRGKVRQPDSIGTFDYATYLRRQGIAGTCYIPAQKWQHIGASARFDLRVTAKRWQHRLVERYRELGITGNELGTLAALTLGYREELDPSIRQAFQRAGAAHVLAVSGLHTGIIYAVLWTLLTGFGLWRPLYEQKWRRRILSLIIIAAMWSYALLTGLTPSVVRSVIMVTIMQTAYMCYRNPLSLNSVAAAAFLILMVRPTDLYSVSFQLSFAAVTAILLICPKAIHIPIHNKWLSYPVDYIVNLAMVSIAAQLGTLPFTLYYFRQCSNYFLLTNLIVIFLAWVTTMLALATLTIGWIPGLGEIIAVGVKWSVWALNTITGWIESLPGAVTVI